MYSFLIIIFAACVVFVLAYLFCSKIEHFKFKLTESTGPKGLISNGTIQKFKDTEGNFKYELMYNLPLPSGGDYIPGSKVYSVYVGKDKNDSSKVGELKRDQDGWFRLSFNSSEELHYAKIMIDDQLVLDAQL